MEEFIAIQIMVAQAQRLSPKLDPFDPNCQHIAFLNSHVKSFSKQFKNTDMRHFKFHWEFILKRIFSSDFKNWAPGQSFTAFDLYGATSGGNATK
jgi:hypothetical protein